jgi:NADPH:quinone reductase-like Zn-dependent oxidoreductase
MKQYRLEKAEGAEGFRLVLRDVEQPQPGPGQVLVRVRATSLNYRDHLAKVGNDPKSEGLVPLSDGAGEIAAIGEGVTRFAVGDRVAGIFFQGWQSGRFQMKYHQTALGGGLPGMLTEYVVLAEDGVVSIPDYLSFDEAATLPCAAVTVWQALFARGGLQPGETVLALGTGGVSIFGLQMAAAAGAQVIITSSSDGKLARAYELGASKMVNYRLTPDWDKEVWQLTEKQGVDHVLEVGGPGTLEKSMNAVGAGGHIALIGVLTGFGSSPSTFPLVARNVRLDGVYVGSRAHFEEMNAFLTQHQIHPVIDQTFAFEDAEAAFATMASGSHFGKIVVRVS